MTGEGRVGAAEYARRVNTATRLLAAGLHLAEAARRLRERFHVSARQAHRYVDRAREGGPVEIPQPTVVFTVKLPKRVVRRLRQYAKATTRTLSSLVAQAVDEFLDRMRAGPEGGG